MKQTDLLDPVEQVPIHAITSEDSDEREAKLLVDSNMSVLIFFATIKGVNVLLLKIHSFLANHSFHQIHFGTICQSLIHSMFLALVSGIHSF